MTISVIIPSYNSAATLPELLKVLCSQTVSEIEIIVVDDCSTDNTRTIVSKFEKVTYLRNKKNLGRAKSRNRGIKASSGELLVFLDSDSIPLSNEFIEQYKINSTMHPDSILMGKRIVKKELIEKDPFTRYLNSREDYDRAKFEQVEYQEFITSNFLISKSSLNDIGLLDEEFVHYGFEDADFAIRAIDKGYNILYCPSCIVKHDDPGLSFEQFYSKFYTFGRYTGKQLFEKHDQAKKGFEFFYYLEPVQKGDSLKKIITHSLMLLQFVVTNNILIYIINNYKNKIPYTILFKIYRLALANQYLKGVAERK